MLSARARALAAATCAALGATLLAAARVEAAPVVAPRISQSEVDAVVAAAQQSGPVEAVEAAAGTIAGAEGLVAPESAGAPSGEGFGVGAPEEDDPSAPASLVVAHGRFVDHEASVPYDAAAPSGSVMAFVVDSAGRTVGQYVGDTAPRLAMLGPVEHMVPLGHGASASRAGGRRFAGVAPRRVATWGNNCKAESYPVNHHCYMIAVWHMEGGEEVEGTESEQDTTNMDVPTWASGDFVTNEEWANFSGSERWTEIGQQGGHGVNCCEVWWFYAMSTGPHQFWTSGRVWQIPPGQYANYGMKSIGNGNGASPSAPRGKRPMPATAGSIRTRKNSRSAWRLAPKPNP